VHASAPLPLRLPVPDLESDWHHQRARRAGRHHWAMPHNVVNVAVTLRGGGGVFAAVV
jgi:phage baseplate assembly protein gpV